MVPQNHKRPFKLALENVAYGAVYLNSRVEVLRPSPGASFPETVHSAAWQIKYTGLLGESATIVPPVMPHPGFCIYQALPVPFKHRQHHLRIARLQHGPIHAPRVLSRKSRSPSAVIRSETRFEQMSFSKAGIECK